MKKKKNSLIKGIRKRMACETTNSAAYNLLVFWCNFYCYSVDSCHCICCDTYSLLPALIFTMLCECFLGHKTYWLSRTQMFNSVCVSSLRNVAVASFMGVFSADSYILFLVWCKLEQNKGKRKEEEEDWLYSMFAHLLCCTLLWTMQRWCTKCRIGNVF